jgi:hypothetical protein|tara:strand:+ start:3126 stop:3473 length:348 start_codon:yes stop_codon:yes gene_type:complete
VYKSRADRLAPLTAHRIMKKKKTKPTIRSMDIKVNELEAVIVRQQEWISYLRNNLDLVSSMFYGYMEMNGDVEKVVNYVENRSKEKEDALSDGKKAEELSRESDNRDSKISGESV